MANQCILVTGGAGFIGSAVVKHLLLHTQSTVINVDKLTYAGNLHSLAEIKDSKRHVFIQADICDAEKINHIFETHHPAYVMHLAAESHVDNSISAPLEFLQTNVLGTGVLLEAARRHWSALPSAQRDSFRFLHVSTDEVFGSLPDQGLFNESSHYQPNSPYSASKASSDHLVRAWHKTYGLPILLTNCSNNYGPFQFPEKLIPFSILSALKGNKIPIYGDGRQVRDWLHVNDHASALLHVLEQGSIGETYAIGGNCERTNLQVVESICHLLSELKPNHPYLSQEHSMLIQHITDRPGHDKRYAIDSSKLKHELAWQPSRSFESGLRETVAWYLHHQEWWENVLSGEYKLTPPTFCT